MEAGGGEGTKQPLSRGHIWLHLQADRLINDKKWSDFIIKKVNWDAKSKNIIEISKMLNLGLESFVFLDDNPSEREEVKLSLPMVTIPDCGENPEDFLAALSIMEPFNTLSSLTKEDIFSYQDLF